MTNFEACWAAQHENQRNAYVAGDPVLMSPLDKIQFVHWNTLAIQAEVVELLDETSWKPWSKNFGDPDGWNPEAMAGEAADIMCFLTNILITAGVTPEQLLATWAEKILRNADRQASGYDVSSAGWKCPLCSRALDDPHARCTEPECALLPKAEA